MSNRRAFDLVGPAMPSDTTRLPRPACMQALLRKWVPLGVVVGIVLLLFWVRAKFYT